MLCTVIFGSTSIISHSSVFPAAIIASFDSLLKGLNARCCWRSFWSASRWGWFSIWRIKSWTLMLCDRFTIAFGTPEMLKSMFSSSIAKLNSVRVIMIFERTNFLHFVRPSFHKFPRSIVISHDAFSVIFHKFLRSIWRTKFSLRLTNNLLGRRFPVRSWMGLGNWVGLEEPAWSASPSDSWMSLPTGWCSTVEP